MVKEITNYGELGKFYIPKEFNREKANEEKARIDYILHKKKTDQKYCHKHMCWYPRPEGCSICNQLDSDNIKTTHSGCSE
jgi:hypothetical protein